MTGKIWPSALLVAGIFLADWASKQWAIAVLHESPPIQLLPFLRLVYVENTGIAFGLFAGYGELGRWLLIASSALLVGVLIYYSRQTQSRWERFAALLIIGGAAGNILDRFRFGYVVDFVDVYIAAYHWPAFNVADMAISIGGVLFACLLFKK